MSDIRRVLSYNDVSLSPRNSNFKHLTDANIYYDYKGVSNFQSIPFINAPMDKVCSKEMLSLVYHDLKMPITIHRWFESPSKQIDFYNSCDIKDNGKPVFLSVGSVYKWKEWIDHLIEKLKKIQQIGFLVDMANGDTLTCVDTVKYIKKMAPEKNLMAGNVATKSGYCRLEEAGANFIRVGIGGGSICTTRLMTGFGVPTLTSVMDCSQVKGDSYLVADGGIEYPGDICKAMVGGADMVMAGKMFAATSLSSGEKYNQHGEITEDMETAKWVSYRGMASASAANSLTSKKSNVSVEGVEGFIPYTGESKDVLSSVHANLRSAVGYYAGCKDWSQFKKRVKFVILTPQGWGESVTRINSSM